MREFYVRFRCLRDIQEFVAIASRQKHRLLVGDDTFQVGATSFMGLFALDCRHPQRVSVECSREELEMLKRVFRKFLAE